jgi:two-component system LytT family response regulator
MLQEIDGSIMVAGVLPSVEHAVRWFAENAMPDLIFMDIQLEDGQSFEIFERIEVTCPIVFTTAYDQYAIRAFRYHSLDYILKPYKKQELTQAYEKFLSLKAKLVNPAIDYRQLLEVLQPSPYRDRILVQIGTQLRSVKIEDMAYFFTRDKIVFLVTHDGKKYPTDFNLDQLVQMLDPRVFYRINRQYIIGIEAIDQMFAYSKSRVRLMLKPPAEHEVIVSTDRSSEFKKWLSGVPGD